MLTLRAIAEVLEIREMAEETEEPRQQSAEGISCKLSDFEPKICRPDKTAILFLGKETENIDNILNALDELQDSLDMDIGVLDMSDKSCEELSAKYKVDPAATQLMIFQNCEKKGAISLDGEDYKEQVKKLKEAMSGPNS